MLILLMLSSILALEAKRENGHLSSLNEILSPFDMKRLESYTNNLADYLSVRFQTLRVIPLLFIFILDIATREQLFQGIKNW